MEKIIEVINDNWLQISDIIQWILILNLVLLTDKR